MPSDSYVPIPGSDRSPIPGATLIGPANPDERLQVTVVLRHKLSSGGHESLAEIIARGERLTRDEYEARYGAAPEEGERVQAFAETHGLQVSDINLAARTVTLAGTVAAFSSAFQVKLALYKYPGGEYRGRTGPVHIPAELKDVIRSVHGLDDRPQAKTHYRFQRRGDPDPTGIANPKTVKASYTAVQVGKYYNFPTGLTGEGQTIAIVELGGGYKKADLTQYFASVGISPEPSVSSVSVDQHTNKPTGSTNGSDVEVVLDIEVAGSVAPGAEIVVYFAPNTDAGFLDAINRAAMDKTHNPSVISISWGGPESNWTAQSLHSVNSALEAAAAVGVTVCVAAGDDGATDGLTDGQSHVDFPASSPYALACGGTTLYVTGGAIASEVVWNELPKNGATGGGVSGTFPLPSWQSAAKVPVSANPGSFKGRGVPDVAGDADPLTGYRVEVDGQGAVVGGTSAVAPLWAGLIALLNQSLPKPVGYLNPNLYQKVAGVFDAFRDITSGNNGAYYAAPGWDACTGWGSPNGDVILKALGDHTRASSVDSRQS